MWSELLQIFVVCDCEKLWKSVGIFVIMIEDKVSYFGIFYTENCKSVFL